MKANIIMIVLSVAILVGGIGLVVYTTSSAQEMIELCQQAVKLVEREDLAAASLLIDQFCQKWYKAEPYWQVVAIHSDLNAVTDTLVRVQDALDQQDQQEAHLQCRLLAGALLSMVDKEAPRIENIF